MFTAELLEPLPKNSGHCRPTRAPRSILVASVATSNPEFHSHLSLVDVITVTIDVAVMMKVVILADSHVESTATEARRVVLGAIEGEIPTTTTVVTVSNPEVPAK